MTNEDGSVTVTLTKDSYRHTENPVLPKLWDIIPTNWGTGIIYRINVSIDEDGKGHTLSIMRWRVSKYTWFNNLKLYWLKIRVKFNWI